MRLWWFVSLYCLRSQVEMPPEQVVEKGVMR